MTGPDEYTAVVNDNLFTNLLAARNLRSAAAACARDLEAAQALGVSTEEAAAWVDAADAVHLPYDPELGVHQQCEGFTRLAEWDFAEHHEYPLLLHAPYVRLYPAQVLKQADVVLAMHLHGDRFTMEQMRAYFEYYDPITTGDSSLSAIVQCIIAAGVSRSKSKFCSITPMPLPDKVTVSGRIRADTSGKSCTDRPTGRLRSRRSCTNAVSPL